MSEAFEDKDHSELEMAIFTALPKLFTAIVENRVLDLNERMLVSSLKAWCDVLLGKRAISAAERQELEIMVGVVEGIEEGFKEFKEATGGLRQQLGR